MICKPEIRNAVAAILALRSPPHAAATWVKPIYTCTYHLPDGPFVLSVTEAASPTAGRVHFDALRKHAGKTRALPGLLGLGLPAFETADGRVAFLKDGSTLLVDASRLPAQAGANHETRNDLAYTIATDVLACWSGK